MGKALKVGTAGLICFKSVFIIICFMLFNDSVIMTLYFVVGSIFPSCMLFSLFCCVIHLLFMITVQFPLSALVIMNLCSFCFVTIEGRVCFYIILVMLRSGFICFLMCINVFWCLVSVGCTAFSMSMNNLLLFFVISRNLSLYLIYSFLILVDLLHYAKSFLT